jgi:hypothetical protein
MAMQVFVREHCTMIAAPVQWTLMEYRRGRITQEYCRGDIYLTASLIPPAGGYCLSEDYRPFRLDPLELDSLIGSMQCGELNLEWHGQVQSIATASIGLAQNFFASAGR